MVISAFNSAAFAASLALANTNNDEQLSCKPALLECFDAFEGEGKPLQLTESSGFSRLNQLKEIKASSLFSAIDIQSKILWRKTQNFLTSVSK